jgi:sarcosine oxidase
MGSAAAAHLASRGLRVLGLEQFGPAHERGASTGRSRIIRKAYFEDPAYVPLLARAYELWRALEVESASDVLRITGMLMLGPPESAMLQGAAASARLHGLDLEELAPEAARERFPAVRVRDGEAALFEPEAGFVRPEAAVAAHLAVARARGADLRFDAPVAGWDATADGVRVTLADGQRVTAGRLVLCLGPWFDARAAELGVEVRVQRNVQAWFRADHERFRVGNLPVFFVDRSDYPAPFYGFPDFGDGIKAAFHGHGETTSPESLRRNADVAELERLRLALDELLPGAGGPVRDAKVCMYSLTPDEHFVIDAHGELPNVIVAGGFSGHGFKFCSVVGEIVADLVERGESRHDIGFLSARRFAGAVP